MRKDFCLSILGCILLLGCVGIAAQDNHPPKILQIVREEIKTGKMPAHNVEANNVVQIWSKAKSPYHRIAMVPVAGNENEVMYVWPFDSYADLEKSGRDLDQMASVTYKADFDRIAAQNKWEDLHTTQRDVIAVLREDLSYNPNVDITKMRYMRTETIRVKPGMDRDWEEGRRILKAAHEKAKIDENMIVYQVVGGMQSGSYMVFIPWKSLDGLGTLPHGKDYWDAMGDSNREKMSKINSEAVMFNDLAIYAFNPQLSYVPAQFVAADPFWTFRPMTASQPADVATRKAPKR
jgi:hypothetical protein